MNVIDSVVQSTGLDLAKVESVVGGILAALTMSVKRDVFVPVQQAIPEADQLISKAAPAPAGGRTGEIFALVAELRSPAGAAKLLGQLARSGLTAPEVAKAGAGFIAFLRQAKGDAAADALLAAAPGLKELA